MKNLRLAKIIANSGLYSRREAEFLIETGKVKIDQNICKNYIISEEDLKKEITVNNKAIKTSTNLAVYKYYKRIGLVTTAHDPENRPTIYDIIKKTRPDLAKFKTVGRLDYNSEGLLLLTNHGEFARKLELPQNNFERTYRVKLWGKYPLAKLQEELGSEIIIDKIRYKPIKMKILRSEPNGEIELTLSEGKNREIRKILAFYDYSLKSLFRIKFGPISLKNMQKDQILELTSKEYELINFSKTL